MFSKASLKFKLIAAFLCVTFFMVVVAIVGYGCLKYVRAEYDYIAEVVVDNLKTTSAMSDRLRDLNQELIKVETYDAIADKKVHVDLWLKMVGEQDTDNKKYEAIPFSPGEEKVWHHYTEDWENYKKEGHAYIALALNPSPEIQAKGKQYLDKEMDNAYKHIREALIEVWNFHEGVADAKGKSADDIYEAANIWTLVISIAGLIFALSVGFYLANLIAKTINTFSNEISLSAEQTSTASNELTSASSQLSQGATESAASLEETVSSLEELSSMVKLNSDHAKEANSLSQKSLQSAESGEKEIIKLIEAMSGMSKSSKKIEEIINVIDDIAFQTNLLALNAAVEAARAGEQGKGFAVVADAVRNLAQRSASAAKDINVLIKENVELTENGVDTADTSGTVLKEIVTSVKKVADLNSEISAASQEQANGIEQISKAMNHLDQAIQGNASSSEEVASSAQEMSAQSESLKELVSSLKAFVHGHGEQHTAPTTKTTAKHSRPSNVKEIKTAKNVRGKNPEHILPFDEKDSPIGKAEGF